jgi:hypothetical protein
LFVALVLKRFMSYFVYEMLLLCLCFATIKDFSNFFFVVCEGGVFGGGGGGCFCCCLVA